MSAPRLPVEGNRQLLRQGVALLDQLDDERYTESRGAWASVGAQYRHVLEHYRCFFAGLGGRRVDYDARARDIAIEASRQEARRATLELLHALEGLLEAPDEALSVHMDSGGGDEGPPDWRPSSVGRELQFLCSHTVHHYALLKLLLDGSGAVLGSEFGVAPSTLAHRAGR